MLSYLITPFAQKFLPHNLNGRTTGFQRINLGGNLLWHYGEADQHRKPDHSRPILDDFLSKAFDNYEALIEQPFVPYESEGADCVVEYQPVWPMSKSQEGKDNDHEAHYPEIPDGCAPHDGPETVEEHCKRFRMEHLAWYAPGHTHDANEYGMHFPIRGVAYMAREILDRCPDEQRDIALLCGLYDLYAHEFCHAWIEDICCLLDFKYKVSSDPADRTYSRVQRRYNGYIFMEESLSNTAAHGWMRHFLFDETYAEGRTDLPKFNPTKLLAASVEIKRGAPKGYRDFVEIGKRPTESAVFMVNLVALIAEIYAPHSSFRWDPHIIGDVVGAYFGRHVYARGSEVHIRGKGNLRDGLWHGSVPEHFIESRKT